MSSKTDGSCWKRNLCITINICDFAKSCSFNILYFLNIGSELWGIHIFYQSNSSFFVIPLVFQPGSYNWYPILNSNNLDREELNYCTECVPFFCLRNIEPVLRRWISRQLSLEGSMRRWFGQYCYKKALTSCKNVPWLKLSWSEPPPGSSFTANHDWNWYWAYYQAANRALRSTGGTLAPERSLPRIAARSGTNCDVTNLSRSSRLLSAAAIIAATTPSESVYPVTKETGHFLKFLSAGFQPSVDRVSIPAGPAFRAPTPPSLVINSLSVAAFGTPTVPPPAHQLIWLSQVTPVCRSQKLLTARRLLWWHEIVNRRTRRTPYPLSTEKFSFVTSPWRNLWCD